MKALLICATSAAFAQVRDHPDPRSRRLRLKPSTGQAGSIAWLSTEPIATKNVANASGHIEPGNRFLHYHGRNLHVALKLDMVDTLSATADACMNFRCCLHHGRTSPHQEAFLSEIMTWADITTSPTSVRGHDIYLNCPYEAKKAKSFGASWDAQARSWYMPESLPWL